MTREEMVKEIAHMPVRSLVGGVSVVGFIGSDVAAAVIRLVVEACAAEMPAFQAHYLRSTFLPPEARDGEAD